MKTPEYQLEQEVDGVIVNSDKEAMYISRKRDERTITEMRNIILDTIRMLESKEETKALGNLKTYAMERLGHDN